MLLWRAFLRTGRQAGDIVIHRGDGIEVSGQQPFDERTPERRALLTLRDDLWRLSLQMLGVRLDELDRMKKRPPRCGWPNASSRHATIPQAITNVRANSITTAESSALIRTQS